MTPANPWQSIAITQLTHPEPIAHMTQHAVLLYVLSGQLTVSSDLEEVHLGVGEFFVIPNFSKVKPTFAAQDSRIYQLSFTYFNQDTTDQLTIFKGDSKSNGEASNSTLSTALQQLLRIYYLNRHTASYWEVGALYFQIINKLEKKYLVTKTKQKGQVTAETLVAYVDQNLTDDLTIEDVAKQFYISKQTAARLVKKSTDQSFHQYLQDQRFIKLEKSLAETDQPINSLAYAMGFKNLNSFNRLFKKRYGLSPKQWRKTYASQPTSLESEVPLEQFDTIQDFLSEKRQQLHFSTQNSQPRHMPQTIWNIATPSLLINPYKMKQVTQLITPGRQERLRFYLDIQKLSPLLYEQILLYLHQHQIFVHLCIRLDSLENNNRLLHFLRDYYQTHGNASTKDWVIEVSYQESTKDWEQEYQRLHHLVKQLLQVQKCGIGNLSAEKDLHHLNTCHNLGTIDFVAIDILPKIKQHSLYSLRENIVLQTKMSQVFTQIHQTVAVMKESLPNTPIILTSFGLTAEQADTINDHLYLATYYLEFWTRATELFDAIGYSFLFDNTSESPLKAEFSGLPGLISHSGLPKSGWYTHEFLQQEFPLLLGQEEGVRVTTNQTGDFLILAHHYQSISDYYSSDKTMDLYQNQHHLFAMQDKTTQVTISDIPNGTYKVTYHIIDLENGSGPKVLSRYTGLKQVDQTMLDFLRTQFQPRIYQKTITVSKQQLVEMLILKPLEIALIRYEHH